LLPGRFRVEITASRLTNRKVLDPFRGKMVVREEQFIPTKYNSQSELEVVIGSGAPNRLDFALTSEKAPPIPNKSAR